MTAAWQQVLTEEIEALIVSIETNLAKLPAFQNYKPPALRRFSCRVALDLLEDLRDRVDREGIQIDPKKEET